LFALIFIRVHQIARVFSLAIPQSAKRQRLANQIEVGTISRRGHTFRDWQHQESSRWLRADSRLIL
jgi:hypothetical protein